MVECPYCGGKNYSSEFVNEGGETVRCLGCDQIYHITCDGDIYVYSMRHGWVKPEEAGLPKPL